MEKPAKRNKQPGAPAFLSDARKEREGEKIGGGFFVFRRGRKSGRIRAPEWPFEHPTFEAAFAEMERLKEQYPTSKFAVMTPLVEDSPQT